MPLPLKDRAVLVTGPAKGMGRAISLAIADAGGDLILVGRDMTAIEPLAEEIRALGRTVLIHAADVTREDEVQAAAGAARAAFPDTFWGAVTVAGVTGPTGRKLWEHTVEDYKNVFDVNVLGTFLTMKAVLPALIEKGRGSLVAIGGTFGFKGVRNFSLYGASKWTLRGMMKSAALEAGAHGVRVNMVSPGGVDGPRIERQFAEEAAMEGISYEAFYKRFAATSALRQLSSAEDIANAVLFLLSDAARNITGQDMLVDGGTIV